MKPRVLGKVNVYVEAGAKRTFAAALDWPGWSRPGRDEDAALAALAAYGPRYARALSSARLGFIAPKLASPFIVVERLKGNATTDFGAPGGVPSYDQRPLDAVELRRQLAILRAAWRTFDQAVAAARGKVLSTGPRGGGRDLTKIVLHALEAEQAYLSGLGWKPEPLPLEAGKTLTRLRAETEAALLASARGEIPAVGPRGGRRWSPRTFIRREAWHALDHAWEIEDRSA